MKLFGHFSILLIVLMSILATALFPRVESAPYRSDDGLSLKEATTTTKSTPKTTTKTTTKTKTTKNLKNIIFRTHKL